MIQNRSRLRIVSSPLVLALSLLALSGASGCVRSASVQTTSSLPLRRVVVYRNGVGYFERQGHVDEDEVRFRVAQREVGDFLATLAVMERGGSSVRAAAFPMPEERAEGEAAHPEERRTVRLSLDGRDHDLLVGYTAETPIWRPSYRLVFNGTTAQVQAWGIVQNLSGEDWSNVRLSLVAGSPVSFRSELAQAVIPQRPVVTDQGAVIDAVPTSETTLAQEQQNAAPAAAAAPAMPVEAPSSEAAYDALEERAAGTYGARAQNVRSRAPRRAPAPMARPPAQPTGGAYWQGNMPSPAPPPPPATSPTRSSAPPSAHPTKPPGR